MNRLIKLLGCSLALLLLPLFSLHAQVKPSVPFSETELSEPVALVMLTIIILLLFVIVVLGSAVKILPLKKRTNNIEKSALLLFILGLCTFSFPTFAQEVKVVAEAVAPSSPLIGGLSKTSFYLLSTIIILELAAIFALLFAMRSIINPLAEVTAELEEQKEKKKVNRYAWFEKLNNTKSVDSESEAQISLGHDYDGIGELDNPTPPWWQWGFRLSVVFAFVYMWVYFVGKNAPLQIEELAIANEKAEIAKEAYLANSANRVDENNVKLLTDEGDLIAGKTLYLNNCAACHLEDGGGLIGPNLTDKYYLHGGSINEVFKTIKYGIQGTGMKSWENDFSAKQIEQLTSFVHTLVGTTPKVAKEPQGELIETATASN